MRDTGAYEGMIAETVTVRGHGGDYIHAYVARPAGPGPFPAVVLIHHLPGWDDTYREWTRTFAYHGYLAIAPDLYCRAGHGSPDDVGAKVRAEGGPPDPRVVGDVEACMAWLRSLPQANGKVGLFGTCSGGRHVMLVAGSVAGVDAAVDCWGGGVVMKPEEITDRRPVAPIDLTERVTCPVLGLFGDEDRAPTPEQVAMHEAALKRHGKQYEFHMYPGAGHGFFYYERPAAYRAEAAVDGWKKVWAFLGTHLA